MVNFGVLWYIKSRFKAAHIVDEPTYLSHYDRYDRHLHWKTIICLLHSSKTEITNSHSAFTSIIGYFDGPDVDGRVGIFVGDFVPPLGDEVNVARVRLLAFQRLRHVARVVVVKR